MVVEAFGCHNFLKVVPTFPLGASYVVDLEHDHSDNNFLLALATCRMSVGSVAWLDSSFASSEFSSARRALNLITGSLLTISCLALYPSPLAT